MDQKDLKHRLPRVVDALVKSIAALPKMQHLNRVYLPSRVVIIQAIERMRQIIYPGYFGQQGLTSENLTERLELLVSELAEMLYEQVRFCMRYRQQIAGTGGNSDECEDCDREAAKITAEFFERIGGVREILASDVQVAFENDPAATSTDETIFCYPGLFSITVQRLAHEFYKLEVPLLPRIMTEHAHSLTGIDIHPGAILGKSFFIDHGTGIVIGETTEIGDNVKIYQGVTLGAVAPAFGQLLRGRKRHPTIQNNVIIYAGATILGGDTIIGEGSTIGGNVFITTSVPAHNIVTAEPPKLQYRERRSRKKPDAHLDFQI